MAKDLFRSIATKAQFLQLKMVTKIVQKEILNSNKFETHEQSHTYWNLEFFLLEFEIHWNLEFPYLGFDMFAANFNK